MVNMQPEMKGKGFPLKEQCLRYFTPREVSIFSLDVLFGEIYIVLNGANIFFFCLSLMAIRLQISTLFLSILFFQIMSTLSKGMLHHPQDSLVVIQTLTIT